MGGNVPLGYDPDGRTLKIKEPDAQVVRTLYDLYQIHGSISEVKCQADRLSLRTAIRTLSSGRLKGGTSFSFGHIYHILTNPIYAGRIRHKTKVYPGQYPALIDPKVWDALQDQMKAGASMARAQKGRSGTDKKIQHSLLIGKVFDETGDRVTPSHTKSSKGHRLRYYVSRRLIRNKGLKDPSGWRLPALELEALVGTLIARHLETPNVQANIIVDATAQETALTTKRLGDLLGDMSNRENEATQSILRLVKRVLIAPGQISVSVGSEEIADILNIDPKRISDECLQIGSQFRHRKRGVETKLILAGATSPRDEVLLKNIAKAHHYFEMIRVGKTYAEIAKAEGVSKHRIQKLIDLAFLAPDVVRDIFSGAQPTGLTSEWLLRHSCPAIWAEQRELFRSL